MACEAKHAGHLLGCRAFDCLVTQSLLNSTVLLKRLAFLVLMIRVCVRYFDDRHVDCTWLRSLQDVHISILWGCSGKCSETAFSRHYAICSHSKEHAGSPAPSPDPPPHHPQHHHSLSTPRPRAQGSTSAGQSAPPTPPTSIVTMWPAVPRPLENSVALASCYRVIRSSLILPDGGLA